MYLSLQRGKLPYRSSAACATSDIDAAAAAFPALQFEVVHGGFAFIEETAFQLARFANVWVNLETTSNLCGSQTGRV
jgi:hypothetical protein